jgi:Cu+-exporting ATPase
MMERIVWKVSGMDCTSCSLTIKKYLDDCGFEKVIVNFNTGDVVFNNTGTISLVDAEKGLKNLGYTVILKNGNEVLGHKSSVLRLWIDNHYVRFWVCFILTFPMFLHMIPAFHLEMLHHPYLQLALATPVYVIGMLVFAKSAWYSIKNGMANMNVLIVLGATAAFFYSVYGIIVGQPDEFLFFETAASIITLVLLGNLLEEKAIATTQAALQKLVHTQRVTATMIAYDEQHQEQLFTVENTDLRVGDLILINTGEQVPMDCKILTGEASVNESLITGESMPIEKSVGAILVGGSTIESGSVKAYVTAVGEEAVLNQIVKLMQDAQGEKPPVQQLADRISAVFVPIVCALALFTLLGNYFFTSIGFGNSLLRSVAVLVIACPCAMGLATPAAVAVGLGRAARNGVMFRTATSLELFKGIKQVVFDKTGTLTTGKFQVTKFHTTTDEEFFKKLVYSLEKHSAHPLAKSLVDSWKTRDSVKWISTEEIKGMGVRARDKEGNIYQAGSWKILDSITDREHSIYVTQNGKQIGWIDVEDTLRPEVPELVKDLHSMGIKTILLSGDRKENCEKLAAELNIQEYYSDQTPAQKLDVMHKLVNVAPTAMVGDGVNDAPALAKATIGISMSQASQLAMQTAQVVLMNGGLNRLPLALGLGKHTYLTIRQNLAWAFLYNILAIPVAAVGFLSPTFGALLMGLSDVILAVNSVRLNFKKLYPR